MSDTLVLKNKLVMPQAGTYLEVDKDEMEYVDGGGWYLNSTAVSNLWAVFVSAAFTFGVSLKSNIRGLIGKAASLIKTCSSLGAKLGASIGTKCAAVGGVVGVIVGVVLCGFIVLNIASFSTAIVNAAVQGTGVELNWFGFWFTHKCY